MKSGWLGFILGALILSSVAHAAASSAGKLFLSKPDNALGGGVAPLVSLQARDTLECGLLQGLSAASRVLLERPALYGDVTVFRAVVNMKYVAAYAFARELERVSGLSIDPLLADQLLLEARTLRAHLTDFYGDVVAFRQKLSELDIAFGNTRDRMLSRAKSVCE